MTKNNIYLPKENIAKVEEVREINNEIPSYEEFMKSYENDGNLNYDDLNGGNMDEMRGYGPCVNSLCSCDCSSHKCVCKSAVISGYEEGVFKIGNHSASGRSNKKEAGGELNSSLFRINDHTGDLRVLGSSVRGKIDKDGANVQLGANLMEFKSSGFEGRAGLYADTGLSLENGVELKAVGFGISVGKKMGFSTPVGEIKVDTDECVIQ